MSSIPRTGRFDPREVRSRCRGEEKALLVGITPRDRKGVSVMPRLTFLSHFVICLAVGSAVFFAAINGVPQTIWADDLSHMTSVIAL
ncbi:MAG TPA: hypothetical protein VFE63_06395, partial [Roseiarcus sp.]|nr:hypothetical protein [Roseiarcus sp.]